MLHQFSDDISAIELPHKFTCPFRYTPHPLCVAAAKQVMAHIEESPDLRTAAMEGKMFGVLVAKTDNRIGFLAAFSGQINGRNTHPYFVPPVFDILADPSFFTDSEEIISGINREIADEENSETHTTLAHLRIEKERILADEKEKMRAAKQRRDEKRQSDPSPETLAAMLRESQFQKAEYKRLERTLNAEIEKTEKEYSRRCARIQELKQRRKTLSAELQKKIFSRFVFLNGKAEEKDLLQIFGDARNCLPPAAAGECAGPRLLQYAYKRHLTPLAMAEFWYGVSPSQEIRTHGNFYPACTHKCEPILNFMLQGLEVEENPLAQNKDFEVRIIYEDHCLLVVDKPAGMLSVRGKTARLSVADWAKSHCGHEIFVAHRLDMETSGLLVIAKDERTYKHLQRQFATHQVRKRYVALLAGTVEKDSGTISLPLRSNYEHRPCQTVDFEHGKYAETKFSVALRKHGQTRIIFSPTTGRTHQLRVHAAHPLGLSCPIVGDNLYGTPSDRMYLHAQCITLRHPETNEIVTFTSPCEFAL